MDLFQMKNLFPISQTSKIKSLFFVLLLCSCLQTRKSPLDLSSPSGMFGIGGGLALLASAQNGPPTVTSVATAGGGIGIQFTFSKTMDPTSITVSSNTGTFQMVGSDGVYLDGTISTADNTNFVFRSITPLTVNLDYSIKILKSVTDTYVITMNEDYIHASCHVVHKYMGSFGSYGVDTGTTNPDKFDYIPGLGIDNTRNRIILADNGNKRVHFYDQNTGTHSIVLSGGGGNPHFDTYNNIFGVCVDNVGNFYISLANGTTDIAPAPYGRVYKVSPSTAGLSNTVLTPLNVPRGIALNSNNITFIAEKSAGRILRYNFSTGSNATDVGAFASGLNGPSGVAIDGADNVYVAEEGANQIRKYNSAGTFITSWGTTGTGNGQFQSPVGIAVDSSGYIYVADYSNNRIQKFDSNGNYILSFNSGSIITISGPAGVAIDSSGNVYIGDQNNHRVQKFGPP